MKEQCNLPSPSKKQSVGICIFHPNRRPRSSSFLRIVYSLCSFGENSYNHKPNLLDMVNNPRSSMDISNPSINTYYFVFVNHKSSTKISSSFSEKKWQTMMETLKLLVKYPHMVKTCQVVPMQAIGMQPSQRKRCSNNNTPLHY